MKLIKPSVEIIPQEEGIDGIYKQIELAGRTCYKSEDKITETSAKDFVKKMIKKGHTAMLEHATVYLKMPDTVFIRKAIKYKTNKYSKTVPRIEFINEGDIVGAGVSYVTTNYRVLVENNWLDDLKYISAPTIYHVPRITLKFITDRGVSHELVRHRVFSFAQESTRYCNYSKDKFNNEITYIQPSWTFDKVNEEFDKDDNCNLLCSALSEAEDCYFALLDGGWTPQQARQVLPNALKTEIVMTGFADDWKRFFDLRVFGVSGPAHPDIRYIAAKAKNVIDEFFKEQQPY